MKLLFAKTNQVAITTYVVPNQLRRNEYRYVCDHYQMMGVSDCEVVLLHGWDHEKPRAVPEISMLLVARNCRLIGEQSNVPSFVWNEFKALEDKHSKDVIFLPTKKKVTYLTKFDILDI
tara:strand:+ start:2941 stop:3297 length:357 start_codon:yes stop_codon:yes gene_type:complete